MQLNAEDGLFLIETAIEKEQEEKAWELWVSTYPHMENPIPFDEFLKGIRVEKENLVKTPVRAEDVIAKAERIRKAHQKGG